MSTKIGYKVEFAVEKGPGHTLSRELLVEAYDHLRVEVPGGDNTTPGSVTVDVQPGAGTQLRFLSITSSLYSELLTFKSGGADIRLDAPHLYVGAGGLSLLGTDPKQFVFTNKAGADKPAVVQILVGRKATA